MNKNTRRQRNQENALSHFLRSQGSNVSPNKLVQNLILSKIRISPQLFLHIFSYHSRPVLTDSKILIMQKQINLQASVSRCNVVLDEIQLLHKARKLPIKGEVNKRAQLLVPLQDPQKVQKTLQKIRFPAYNNRYQLLMPGQNTLIVLVPDHCLQNKELFVKYLSRMIDEEGRILRSDVTVTLQLRMASNLADDALIRKVLKLLSSTQLPKIFAQKKKEFEEIKTDEFAIGTKILKFKISHKLREQIERQWWAKAQMNKVKEIYQSYENKPFSLCIHIRNIKRMMIKLDCPNIKLLPLQQGMNASKLDVRIRDQSGEQRSYDHVDDQALIEFLSAAIERDGFQQIKLLLPEEKSTQQNLEKLNKVFALLSANMTKLEIEFLPSTNYRIQEEFEKNLKLITLSTQLFANIPLLAVPSMSLQNDCSQNDCPQNDCPQNDCSFIYLDRMARQIDPTLITRDNRADIILKINLSQLLQPNLSFESFMNLFDLTDFQTFSHLAKWDSDNASTPLFYLCQRYDL